MIGDTNSNVSHSYHDNLETFSLAWLDTQVDTTEYNRQTQEELRQIINHLKIFDDQQRCHDYITSLSAQDRLVLIVSGQLGRQLIPQIYHLRQLSSIYVFCQNKQANEQWARKFTKIKNVIIAKEDLLHQIKADQQLRVKVEEPLSIKIYHDKNNLDQSTTVLNGHCVHSLLLIDVLLRMKPTESDKHELIKFCKDVYKDNDVQLALVNEFERGYTPSKALWWYTCESFVYRMLNKALRIQNIELLYLFRFLIGDIYHLLQRNQCQSSVRVYRGQVISSDELHVLQRSIGKLISISSFFSTSTSQRKALQFLGDSNDLHRVLFIIEADPRVVKSKPFANISQFSVKSSESEVLFMTGCMFRLIEIDQNDDKIWMIQMQLCDDDQHDLKTLFNHMKNEYGCGENEVSLQCFGDVLRHMGKNDLAEKMYHRLFIKLSPNDPSYSILCYSFGMISKDRNKYDISLEWFQKSLEIQTRTDPSNYVYIASLYCCIGNVQMDKGNDQKAIQCYNQAIKLYNQAHTINHQLIAAAYHGIAMVYQKQKKYPEALVYYVKSLTLQEQYLPSEHSDLAKNLHNIGTIYYYLEQYDEAMNNYKRSLAIQQKSLPSDHLDIATSCKSIGVVYERLKNWKQALKYYQEASSIYRHLSSLQHPDAIELQKHIQRISLHTCK